MNKYLIVILCSFFALNGNGQKTDDLKSVYNNQTIYRLGGYFMKGSDRMSFQDLEKEFAQSEIGQGLYLKAKKSRTTSRIFRYVSLFTSVATLAFLSDHSSNRNTVYILLGGQLVTGYVGARYNQQSVQYLDRALWQRNKDVLFPQ